jgi:hypothetical protein
MGRKKKGNKPGPVPAYGEKLSELVGVHMTPEQREYLEQLGGRGGTVPAVIRHIIDKMRSQSYEGGSAPYTDISPEGEIQE